MSPGCQTRTITDESKVDSRLADRGVGLEDGLRPVVPSHGDRLPGDVLHHQLDSVRSFVTGKGGAERQRTGLQGDRQQHHGDNNNMRTNNNNTMGTTTTCGQTTTTPWGQQQHADKQQQHHGDSNNMRTNNNNTMGTTTCGQTTTTPWGQQQHGDKQQQHHGDNNMRTNNNTMGTTTCGQTTTTPWGQQQHADKQQQHHGDNNNMRTNNNTLSHRRRYTWYLFPASVCTHGGEAEDGGRTLVCGEELTRPVSDLFLSSTEVNAAM
ncbi:hypothetical protein EYF80_057609 [Liparis tanakae]|uniref:Uncharacterized protein n=1 Tax=Liparis tanakae TaxID=230148 RepID=A0A4Z2EV45_9TELE|nr:hypothetical protein EYF80_057609 [Liparis tanakae]